MIEKNSLSTDEALVVAIGADLEDYRKQRKENIKPTLTEWLEKEVKLDTYNLDTDDVYQCLLDKIKAGEFSGL